jgi:preprotein translocase subunit YajC
MYERAVFMPLAQLNTTVGGSATSTGAPAVERGTTAGAAAGTAGAGGGGGAAATGGGAATGAGAATGGAGGNAVTSAPGTAASGPAGDAAKPTGGSILGTIVPIALMFVVLYLFLFRGQRKQEKKRKDMISEMKKGDRVMTIGGLIARVVSVEGDEVVLKIDESANVKATYSKKAIQEMLDRDEKK